MVDLSHYERGSRDMHRLRVLVNKEKPILGMSLPKDKVAHLLGVWFTTKVDGTNIILESGSAPVKK